MSYERAYNKALRLNKIGVNNEFVTRLKLLPMYMRHQGRILANKVGMGRVLDKVMCKNGK